MENKSKITTPLVRIVLVSVLCGMFSFSATAQISIVVAKSSPYAEQEKKIDESEFKKIFSAAKPSWNTGAKILVVYQEDSEMADAFYKEFVRKSIKKVRREWTKLALSGQAIAPVFCKSDEEVKAAIIKNGNAIGFISSSNLDENLTELLQIKSGDSPPNDNSDKEGN